MKDRSLDAYKARIHQAVPIAGHLGLYAEYLGDGEATLIMPFGAHLSRPPQVVSGPALMGLADFAMGAAVHTCFEYDVTVLTADMNIHFVRKAVACDIRAFAKVLKSGKTLSVTEVKMVDAATGDLVAHATASFAVQPQNQS